jgi:hypothetical protein
VAAIAQRGGRAVATTASVATEEGAQAIIDTATTEFGRIDAVINNAGIYSSRTLSTISLAEFRAFFDVHFFGSLLVARAAWPYLATSGHGRIVNTISSAMMVGALDMIHYGSAKAAVYGLTRNLAVAGHEAGIKVNAILPGAGTRMIDEAAEALPPGGAEYIKQAWPASLVAPVAAYLAHPACTLTGEVLNAMGGAVSRVVVGNSPGINVTELTPELVLDRLDEILASDKVEPLPLLLPTRD